MKYKELDATDTRLICSQLWDIIFHDRYSDGTGEGDPFHLTRMGTALLDTMNALTYPKFQADD